MTWNITAYPQKWFFTRSTSKSIIEKDIQRWIIYCQPDRVGVSKEENLIWLIQNYQEFRNLFYYRIGSYTKIWSRYILSVSKKLYKPMDTLFINSPSIGPGLFIQHGFSTIIEADKIGENCIINQDVTIGYKDEFGKPILGNNVHICAGAKVLGKIVIGDNSIIGANAVVTKNVPPYCTVAGVPARIIRLDGKRVDQSL
jgi:serine O-acetyltransferase